MILAAALSSYVLLNVLLVAAVVFLGLVTAGLRRRSGPLSARAQLQAHQLIIGTVCALVVALWAAPKPALEPLARVWSASSLAEFSHPAPLSKSTAVVALGPHPLAPAVSLGAVEAGSTLFMVLIAALGFLRLGRDLLKLTRIRHRSYVVRQIGAVRVLVNDELDVPFSLWTPGRAEVFVPSHLLMRSSELRLVILHELQHHRQGDTRWVYGLAILKALCCLNPVVIYWSRWISEIQEFACDETLVDLKRVDSRQYARCLIEVAETALARRHQPVGAIGLVLANERQLLKRRIETMLSSTATNRTKRSIGRSALALIVFCLTATAWASRGLVQDRRISMAQAQAMAAKAEADAGLPIAVNDEVLKELNRYLGTSEGRADMLEGLKRMETYRPVLEAKTREYQTPLALLAIPLIESGYRNLEPRDHKPWGAGIWMFIVSTARNYGLRIDEKVDQRLMPELETDAAMRLLKSDYLRFNDWGLAILSYNAGSRAVQESIEATGSRDPWQLVRSGLKTDRGYLAKVMAAILIYRNPEELK